MVGEEMPGEDWTGYDWIWDTVVAGQGGRLSDDGKGCGGGWIDAVQAGAGG